MKEEIKMKLGVDINNIRKILISEYTELCDLLNDSPKENENIIINARKIKSHMDLLRTCIAILATTFIQGREDFQAIEEKELPIFKLPNA